MINFNCPNCNHLITVPDSAAGHGGVCPRCQTKVQVPKGGASAGAKAAGAAGAAGKNGADVNDGAQTVDCATVETRIVCPYCRKDISPKAKKCRHCGNELAMEVIPCPACGESISPLAKKCWNCGKQIGPNPPKVAFTYPHVDPPAPGHEPPPLDDDAPLSGGRKGGARCSRGAGADDRPRESRPAISGGLLTGLCVAVGVAILLQAVTFVSFGQKLEGVERELVVLGGRQDRRGVAPRDPAQDSAAKDANQKGKPPRVDGAKPKQALGETIAGMGAAVTGKRNDGGRNPAPALGQKLGEEQGPDNPMADDAAETPPPQGPTPDSLSATNDGAKPETAAAEKATDPAAQPPASENEAANAQNDAAGKAQAAEAERERQEAEKGKAAEEERKRQEAEKAKAEKAKAEEEQKRQQAQREAEAKAKAEEEQKRKQEAEKQAKVEEERKRREAEEKEQQKKKAKEKKGEQGKPPAGGFEEVELRSRAEKGDPKAQYELAKLLAGRNGSKNDLKEAVRWYSKADEKNHPEAQYELGICYRDGKGVDKNPKKAKELLSKAARQGVQDAQKALDAMDKNKQKNSKRL